MPFCAVMMPPAALVMPPAKLLAAITQMPAEPAVMLPLLVTPPVRVATEATSKRVTGKVFGTKPTPMPTLAESVPLLLMPPANVLMFVTPMAVRVAAIEPVLMMLPENVRPDTSMPIAAFTVPLLAMPPAKLEATTSMPWPPAEILPPLLMPPVKVATLLTLTAVRVDEIVPLLPMPLLTCARLSTEMPARTPTLRTSAIVMLPLLLMPPRNVSFPLPLTTRPPANPVMMPLLLMPPLNVETELTETATAALPETKPALVMPPAKVVRSKSEMALSPAKIMPVLRMPLVMTEPVPIAMPLSAVMVPALEIWPETVLALVTLMPVGPPVMMPVPVLTTLPENDLPSIVMQLSGPELVTGNGPV